MTRRYFLIVLIWAPRFITHIMTRMVCGIACQIIDIVRAVVPRFRVEDSILRHRSENYYESLVTMTTIKRAFLKFFQNTFSTICYNFKSANLYFFQSTFRK